MVAMETITAFVDGPLCFLTAAAFAFESASKYRYVFQLAVSICQLYGDTLYFFTEMIEGYTHSEMWHPLHFWFYFLFLNSIWIIVPSINIVDAFFALIKSQEQSDRIYIAPKKKRSPKKNN
jgi:cholestenol delta-isomerase